MTTYIVSVREVIELIVNVLKLSDKLSNKTGDKEMSGLKQEWINTIRSKDRPTINLPLKDYVELVAAIGKCAMILDRNEPKIDEIPIKRFDPNATIQAVNDVDLIEDINLHPEENRELLDQYLESDQAFLSLSESLGLN